MTEDRTERGAAGPEPSRRVSLQNETDADEVAAVARAIKACTDGFQDPVHCYIQGEAQRRWEAANPDGDWYDTLESRDYPDDLASYEIIARAVLACLRDATQATEGGAQKRETGVSAEDYRE